MATHAVVLMGPQAPQALGQALRKVQVKIRHLSSTAAEAHFDREPAEKAVEALRAQGGYDVACVPLEGREKKLLLADMDSTIVEEETLDELASAFGFGPQVRGITDLAMKGELDFDDALRRRVGLLHGLAIDEALAKVRERTTLTEGALILVRTMRTRGAHTALVTGGFDVFAGPLAEAIGFNDVYANRLRSADGFLTGQVAEPILGPNAKAERLHLLCKEHGLQPSDAIAVGDGANDVNMIEAAGIGIGYRPKRVLERSADVSLQHADLTALLALQGIPESEWIKPKTVSL
ncbi:MAG: phosphoserine phosphatase SerB [Parvularculaceae bacterium]|nr:phosphoserine phosphatase SerB [Parvularculaceae bacterium]